MPVPDFDHNDVLPPHVGDVTVSSNMSPYRVTTLELVMKLGTSIERRVILIGLLDMRDDLRRIGFSDGFQWIDGSFVEDVAKWRGDDPHDVDVVTFCLPVVLPTADPALLGVLRDHGATKTRYRVDHQIVSLGSPPERVVDSSRFWFGLFSHQRGTAVWKGMLHIDLMTPNEDIAAREHLAAITLAHP